MRHPFKFTLAMLALITPALLAGSVMPPANAAGGQVRVVTANLGDGASDDAVNAVDTMSAHVVTFQEICYPEYLRWKNQYGWEGEFSRMTEWHENDGNGCVGQEKGSAILHRPQYDSTVHRMNLPGDTSGKEYQLLCLGITGIITDELYVCTTHLSVLGDGYRTSQLNAAMAWLGPWADWSRHVVFTGDLNTHPNTASLTQVYNKYKEVSGVRNGAPATTADGRKLDYIFGDRPVASVSMDQVANWHGDGHNIVRGWLNF